MRSNRLYQFKEQDPVLYILRQLIETRATMDGKTFYATLVALANETGGEVSYGMLNNWFYGNTKSPRYCSVARVYLAMRAYSRKPVSIGDTEVSSVDLTERSLARRAA